MNTKTMRLPPRRLMTAGASGSGSGSATANNKRKDRDDGFERHSPKPPIAATATTTTTPTTTTATKLLKPDKPRAGSEPISGGKGSKQSNQLLAGYLAHEFLTRGTLFGQPWDPARAEGPIATENQKMKGKPSGSEEGEAGGTASRRAEPAPEEEKYERYVEVAGLLKGDGAHLVDVVNPTQLARFLQL